MARTLFTGWRTVTPGTCSTCGSDDDYTVDGRGNILCSCQACPECGELDAYGFHKQDCPALRSCDGCYRNLHTEPLSLSIDDRWYCEPCYEDRRGDAVPCATCGHPTFGEIYCTDCAADWSLVATA